MRWKNEGWEAWHVLHPKQLGGRSGAITCTHNTMYIIQYCIQWSIMLYCPTGNQYKDTRQSKDTATTNWETDHELGVPFCFYFILDAWWGN